MSILAHSYNRTIHFGVGAPGNGWYIVDVLNATDINIISMLTENVQLYGSKWYYYQMGIHTSRRR